MKAFIVAAFLVASVAAQSMDLMDLVRPTHRRSMSTVEDLLLKEKLGGRRHHSMDFNTFNKDSIYDVEDIIFGGRRGGVSVLSFEELVSHPIFREYLQLPLFVKLWEEHPVVFRKFVESKFFQTYFTRSEFVMMFRNPIMYYKYVVPLVQIIAETVVPTTTEGIYDYPTTTSRFNPYSSTFGYNTPRYNREWSVPMSTMRQSMYPTTSTTHYKYLLEKMMNHLKMNKMGQELTETLTDVKMLPNGHVKEQTFGKIVDPITGQEKITVGDVKLVDEKIVPVQGMNFPLGFEGMTKEYEMNKIFGHKTLKDILLKHIILNKLYGDKQVITPEVYRTLFSEHKEVFPEIYNRIFKNRNVMVPEVLESVFGENKKVLPREVFETLFNTKKTFTPEIFTTLFPEHKQILEIPELVEILMKGNKHVMSPRVLEQIFGKKVYYPEVYGKLFDNTDKMTINSEEELYPTKYNVDYEPYTFNKVNRFTVNPLVSRMLTKNTMLPKMTLEKIQTEKMIEEIQKEKIMSHLLNKNYNVESEIPTFTTEGKLRHIPLTFGKPLGGSSIEEILREKEIKY